MTPRVPQQNAIDVALIGMGVRLPGAVSAAEEGVALLPAPAFERTQGALLLLPSRVCSHRPHGGHLRQTLDDDATAERERSVRCGTRVVLSGLHELPEVLLRPLARP